MKALFGFIIIACTFLCSNAQKTTDDDIIKQYWYYRNRLQYFVVPGTAKGEGQVVTIRNRDDLNNIGFGQHNIYFGYYLGMLATEYYLLGASNAFDDQLSTLQELTSAINQWINFLDNCEAEHYPPKSNKTDGFFIRTDVGPADFFDVENHKSRLNKGLTVDDFFKPQTCQFGSLPRGFPGYADDIFGHPPKTGESYFQAMGQDEAIGLLLGLALIKKFVDDDNLQQKAKQIAYNVVDYIANNHLYDCWLIYDPNGNRIKDDDGGNATTYSYGFAKAAQYFFDSPIIHDFITPIRVLSAKQEWDAFQLIPGAGGPSNSSMEATLAAIGNSWSQEVPIPVPPFIEFVNSTPTGIDIVITQDWEPFYELLYKCLHSDGPLPFLALQEYNSIAKSLLLNGPEEGPYYYCEDVHSGNGWASTYRWHHKTDIQNNGDSDFPGNYNGLDYMLLANLHFIIQLHYMDGVNLADYHHYNVLSHNSAAPVLLPDESIMGSKDNPLKRVYFTSITSTTKVMDKTYYSLTDNGLQLLDSPIDIPGGVEYTAGEIITLEPGFSVYKTANFRARIVSPHIFYPTFAENTFLASKLLKSLSVSNDENQCNSYDKDELHYQLDSTKQNQNFGNCVSCYPNPTTGPFFVNVKCNLVEYISPIIRVLNTTGVVFFEKIIKPGVTELDLSLFPSGVYFLQVIDSQNCNTVRVIKI